MATAVARAGADFVNGAISTSYLKSVTDPKYANDAVVKQYRNLLKQYGPDGADSNNQFFFYGFAKAYDTVRLLYAAGKNPTRAALMRATQHMNWVNPYTLKGVKVKTGKTDRFPISQIRLIRFNNPNWTEFGSLFNGRG
jgi:branched-chain amino acid transport system substrate-binding protein